MNWWETVDWQDPINPDCPLNAGIVGWWMGAPGLFGGTRMWDLTNRNHGTLTNMNPVTAWQTSQYGPALVFDGSTSVITLPTAAELLSNQFTVASCGTIDKSDGTCPIWSWTTSSAFPALYPYHSTSGVDRALLYLGANNFRYFNAGQAVNGDTHSHVFTQPGNGGQSDILDSVYYVDGRASSVISTTSSGAISTKASAQIAGARSADRFLGRISFVIYSNSVWSSTMVADFEDQWRRGFPDMLNRWRRKSYFIPQADTTSRLLHLRRRMAA